MSDLIKVKVLRTTQHGELYLVKGEDREIPVELAKRLSVGAKPAVKLVGKKE